MAEVIAPQSSHSPQSDDLKSYLRELFFSRTDVFPIQHPDGTYSPVRRELTDDDLEKHLSGEIVLGTYQLSPNNEVKWICWDIDYHDGNKERALSYVQKLQNYLKHKFPKSYAVEFTGGSGYHVWLFVKTCPASRAKAFAEIIATELGIECEIFPKQETLPAGGLGSLVKLPLGRHMKTGGWSIFLHPASLSEIELAELPPVEPKEEDFILVRAVEPVNLAGCVAFARLCQGVEEGMRDEAGFFIARFFYAMGVPADMALAALKVWNKKNKPPMDERTVEEKIRSAYRKGYHIGHKSLRNHELLGKLCIGCRREVCIENTKKKETKAKIKPPEVILV